MAIPRRGRQIEIPGKPLWRQWKSLNLCTSRHAALIRGVLEAVAAITQIVVAITRRVKDPIQEAAIQEAVTVLTEIAPTLADLPIPEILRAAQNLWAGKKPQECPEKCQQLRLRETMQAQVSQEVMVSLVSTKTWTALSRSEPAPIRWSATRSFNASGRTSKRSTLCAWVSPSTTRRLTSNLSGTSGS